MTRKRGRPEDPQRKLAIVKAVVSASFEAALRRGRRPALNKIRPDRTCYAAVGAAFDIDRDRVGRLVNVLWKLALQEWRLAFEARLNDRIDALHANDRAARTATVAKAQSENNITLATHVSPAQHDAMKDSSRTSVSATLTTMVTTGKIAREDAIEVFREVEREITSSPKR